MIRSKLRTAQTPPVHLLEGTRSTKVFLAKTSTLCDQECTGTRVGAPGRRRRAHQGGVQSLGYTHSASPEEGRDILHLWLLQGHCESSFGVDQHPISKPEDIFASLSGGQRFSTLDFTQVYQQLVLDEGSQELVMINTHLGLYRFKCLPVGVASVPAIF